MVRYFYGCTKCGATESVGEFDGETRDCGSVSVWDERLQRYTHEKCDGSMRLRSKIDMETGSCSAVGAMLNEAHRWEQDGMYNPHAVPMRDTPMYERFVREGRIVEHNGTPCLRTRNREEYRQAMKDMGYVNPLGDGEISKSRQADQRDRRCQS